MFRKIFSILSLLGVLISIESTAVEVKKCPSKIRVSVDQPDVTKWYAKNEYAQYFRRSGPIEGVLALKSKANSICFYESIRKSRFVREKLYGTERNPTDNPLTLMTELLLPIKGKISSDVGDAIVFTRLISISLDSAQVDTQLPSDLYYRSENCAFPDCMTDYIRLGTFGAVSITVLD